MPKSLAIVLILFAVTALAEPTVTVLSPTPQAISSPGLRETIPGSASMRAGGSGTSIHRIADSLYASDVAVHVLDALQGPLPINREFVLAARQARSPLSVVLIANVDALYRAVGEKDGRELLVLEEAEMRALLEFYGVGGADTLVYHDSAFPRRATAGMAGDRSRLAADLGAMDGNLRGQETLQPASGGQAEIYLLAEEEAPAESVTIEGTATLDLWIGGHSAAAEIAADGTVNPADVASVGYRTDAPLPSAVGARMLLIRNDRIVGIGVVSEVRKR